MRWYLKVLRQYVDFAGRARRTEYWMFLLFSVLASIVLAIVDVFVLGAEPGGIGILSGIYSLAVLLPSLAVAVRRLHDTDRSGFWVLLSLIPIVGGIVLLVWFCLEGQRAANRFGPDPKSQVAYA